MENNFTKKEFDEFYNIFEGEVEKKNTEIEKKFSASQIEFVSKEMLSYIVAECLMEDIEMISELKDKGFSKRYKDSIIRNMCEQIIQYLYIIKHQELIKEYFGEKIKKEWNGTNVFNGLKRTGGNRFEARKSVSEMASDIGEKKSDNDKIALYDIYSVKAELEHNSYFYHLLNEIGKLIDENDKDYVELKDIEDIDYLYLVFMLTSFKRVYDTI